MLTRTSDLHRGTAGGSSPSPGCRKPAAFGSLRGIRGAIDVFSGMHLEAQERQAQNYDQRCSTFVFEPDKLLLAS